MNHIFLKLFIFTVLSVSFNSYSLAQDAFPANRVSAVGTDPNDVKVEPSQTNSGIMIEGFKPDVPYCKDCQNRNKLLLTDTKDNAQPGKSSPASSSGTSTSGGGQSNK